MEKEKKKKREERGRKRGEGKEGKLEQGRPCDYTLAEVITG